jgi:hypothetical protein
MNVVSFYAPRPEHPRAWDYLPMLALLEESCKRYGHRHIVLSDADLPGFDVFRCQLQRELMPATLEAQLQYLIAHDEPTLMTGADCVLGMDPAAVFERTFDVAMTTDRFPGFCLNTGAMFIKDCGLAAAFRDQALRMCGNTWGDDQIALEKAFGATPEPSVRATPEGRVIECLPMFPYHYAPRNVDSFKDAYVVHFRGQRKVFMAEYCKRHLKLVA